MIEILPYQANWSVEFRSLAKVLRVGLGDLALRIDHIGSTAVPGLAAKDILDLQVSVRSLDESVLHALKELGYAQVETIVRDHTPAYACGAAANPEQWKKWFFRPPTGQRRAHLHVRVAGRENERFALLFRDFLRANPAAAAAYAELKRRLAASLADPNDYPEVKDPAVDLVMIAAEVWAKSWRLGPSDE